MGKLKVPRKAVKRIKRHSLSRAKERYGSDNLSQCDIEQIAKMIQNNECEHIVKISHTRRIVRIEYKGKEYFPVYSKTALLPVTFLPVNAKELEEYHNGKTKVFDVR